MVKKKMNMKECEMRGKMIKQTKDIVTDLLKGNNAIGNKRKVHVNKKGGRKNIDIRRSIRMCQGDTM